MDPIEASIADLSLRATTAAVEAAQALLAWSEDRSPTRSDLLRAVAHAQRWQRLDEAMRKALVAS